MIKINTTPQKLFAEKMEVVNRKDIILSMIMYAFANSETHITRANAVFVRIKMDGRMGVPEKSPFAHSTISTTCTQLYNIISYYICDVYITNISRQLLAQVAE